MTYDWLYLCGDPDKLRITLAFLRLQDRPPMDMRSIIVGYCSHLDPDNRYIELMSAAASGSPVPLEVRDLSPLVCHLPKPMMKYWDTGKHRWSLAVKLLLPAMFTNPFLYTDDDVVMFSDPQPMGSGWGSKGSFRLPVSRGYVAAQIWEAFGLPDTNVALARNQYNANALDAGVFFSGEGWNANVRHLWLTRLEQFAECEYIKYLTTNNLELRCLDQRFLTAWGVERGWYQKTISNGFAPPAHISKNLTLRHPFLHYKTSSRLSKERWKAALKDYYNAEVERRNSFYTVA